MRRLSQLMRRDVAAALAMLVCLATVSNAQTSGRKSGDVNNDGTVSSVDALAVLNAVVELPPATGHTPSWGDANCDGKVTALDAQIILAHTVSLDVSQFCVNKVPTAVVALITVDAGTGQVVAGGTLQLSATPRDSTNTALQGKSVSWSTSDAAKATVSTAGVVTGVAAGDVTITATADGKTGTAVVTVLAASTAATLEMSPRTTTVLKDSTVTLSAVVKDAAGNPIAGRTITWTVEKSAVVEVTSSGVVKGLTLGTSKVYATSNAQKDSATVTVTAAGATATRTWTGAASTEWGVAGNWNPATVPVATDTVYIPAAPPNQPELKQTTVTIAGLVVQTAAKVNVGTNELQVTGRVDVDGEVLGAGKLTVQGVSSRESYVRGKLPNLTIIGSTVIVGTTTVTGTLEVTPTSLFDVNGLTVTVTGNLNMRGGLKMQSTAATLDVDGNARFFNDAQTTTAALTAGTLKVAGNFTVSVPGATVANPFPARGTHRTILDGASQQFVRDTGLALVEFQELDVSNTSGGVVFEAAITDRFRVNGRMTVLTGAAISGPGRVNVMQHFTAAAGGSVTLRNLAVSRSLASGGGFKPDTLTLIGGQIVPAGSAYEYQTVVAAASATLSGATSTAGSLIIGCVTTLSDCVISAGGSVNVDGQRLIVAKDVRQGGQSSGRLSMIKAADSVVVRGSLLGPVGLATGATEFTVNDGDWTAGTLRVGGDFRGRGAGAKGAHVTILDGATSQSLRIIKGFSFQALTIADSAGVVMNDTTATAQQASGRQRTVTVKGDFNITTPVKLTGTGRMDVAGNVQTSTGSSIEVSAISIGSTLQSAGAFTPDTAEFNNPGTAQTIQNLPNYNTVLVRGKAAFGGSMTFKGSLIVLPGAELNVESRHVTVTKSLIVSGILRMQDARDTLTVLGDSASFPARNDAQVKNYATSGVLRVAGHIRIDSTGFYPTGSHKTVFNGGSNKTARGVFHNLEIAGTVAGGVAVGVNLRSSIVRGALTATNGVSKIRMDSVTVDGDAVLTQRDTILTGGNSNVGDPPRVLVKGNLTMRTLTAIGPLTEVTGNLTLIDSAMLAGTLIFGGTYTEQGVVLNEANNWAVLKGVNGVVFTQQPTNTKVNTPFSPVVTVELRTGSNQLKSGTMPIRVANPTSFSGTTRVVTVNGVGTFTGLAPKNTTTTTLQLLFGQVNGTNGFIFSNSFTVSP